MTTQSPKEKRQKDKQRSTKHAHKTKDRTGDFCNCLHFLIVFLFPTQTKTINFRVRDYPQNFIYFVSTLNIPALHQNPIIC
jgi:hypothetical protein